MCVAVCCGLSAALMGLASGVGSMTALWTLQALLQGVGWPTAAKLLLDGVPPAELGYYWGLISVAGNVGQSFAPLAMALLCERLDAGWELIFFAAGGAQADLALLCMSPVQTATGACAQGWRLRWDWRCGLCCGTPRADDESQRGGLGASQSRSPSPSPSPSPRRAGRGTPCCSTRPSG